MSRLSSSPKSPSRWKKSQSLNPNRSLKKRMSRSRKCQTSAIFRSMMWRPPRRRPRLKLKMTSCQISRLNPTRKRKPRLKSRRRSVPRRQIRSASPARWTTCSIQPNPPSRASARPGARPARRRASRSLNARKRPRRRSAGLGQANARPTLCGSSSCSTIRSIRAGMGSATSPNQNGSMSACGRAWMPRAM